MLFALDPLVTRRNSELAPSSKRIGDRPKLGLTIRVIEMSNPLAAIDIDKVDDHALVEAILAGRA